METGPAIHRYHTSAAAEMYVKVKPILGFGVWRLVNVKHFLWVCHPLLAGSE